MLTNLILPHLRASRISLVPFAALAMTAILVAPLWLVAVVPVQDGYIHLAQSTMIARFGWGGALSGPAATFLRV
jgi:hypothetical protein